MPDQISVIGFDDVPDAANYRPPLTTVRQDFTALAVAAVDALVAEIEGVGSEDIGGESAEFDGTGLESDVDARRIVPTHLIERSSIAQA